MRRLANLESQVRDLVVALGYECFARRTWYQIVAALDNLGDTTLALQNFQSYGLGRASPGKYLRLFGLLQCVYMQQDSICFLHKALLGSKLRVGRDSAWFQIRELRNRIGGHPAERAGAVARISIERTGFKVMHWNQKRDAAEVEHVDFSSLYSDYRREAVGAVLELHQALLEPSYQPPGTSRSRGQRT